MEVHHHPIAIGSHTPRKKWTHYFWEFIMLFLAVFCGFLAENQREHMIEHKREKKYIRSLIQDIGTDSTNMNTWLHRYRSILANCDSALSNFPANSTVSPEWKRNMDVILFGYPDFISTDQTMQQLKNAGGLRLIRQSAAIDSINAYDLAARDVQIDETAIRNYYVKLIDKADEIFSYRGRPSIENNFWIRYDPMDLEKLFNLVYKYKAEVAWFMQSLENLKKRGAATISFLKEKYHLK